MDGKVRKKEKKISSTLWMMEENLPTGLAPLKLREGEQAGIVHNVLLLPNSCQGGQGSKVSENFKSVFVLP
jgi:hypothetical protein